MPRYIIVIFSLLALLAAAGCTKSTLPYRMSPDYKAGAIRSLAVAPPDVEIFELTATGRGSLTDQAKGLAHGHRTPRPEQQIPARQQVSESLFTALKERNETAAPLQMADKQAEAELQAIQALYRAVNISVRLHTYKDRSVEEEMAFLRALFLNPETELPESLFQACPFPEKAARFDYSVGPIESVLKKGKGEALLLVGGFDEISTMERRGLLTVGMAVNTAVGSKLPVGIPGMPQPGRTAISTAIIDESGAVIWYNVKGSAIDDLTSPKLTNMLMKGLVEDLPQGVVRP